MTETEIVNRALGILGHTPIDDFNNTEDPVAVRCKDAFYAQLDATLRDHWWNCAKDMRRITMDANAPAHTWSYRYLLPVDCVRVRLVDESADWERQGRYILTNETSPIDIQIIKKITNVTELDADFVDAFEYRLAARLATVINHDAALGKGLQSNYLLMIEQAKMNDGQEGKPRAWQGTGRYRAVRGL